MSSTDDNSNSSVLTFAGVGVPPYSARGLTQSLAPIAQASQTRRTVNGSLSDLSMSQFRKYTSTIATGSGFTDQQPPAVSGVWPGQEIVVDCIAELSYLTATGAPERDVVDGSQYTDGDFTFYRPQITFRVLNFTLTKDEYAAESQWSMDLEEV